MRRGSLVASLRASPLREHTFRWERLNRFPTIKRKGTRYDDYRTNQ